MSDWPWVIAAYALTWIVLAVYALVALRSLERARFDLEVQRTRSNSSTEVEP